MHTRSRLAALALTLGCAAPIVAQDLPPYVPLNPVLASRSPLYAQPMITLGSGWRFRTVMDYSNVIEKVTATDHRVYLLDAEILQLDLWVTKRVSKRLFLLGDLPIRGAYNGFLDDFLIWYHKVIGLKVPARDQRPLNQFGWEIPLPDTTISRTAPGTFLGDLRVGAGWDLGRVQVSATMTLPTATTNADGWSRDAIGTAVSLTAKLVQGSRVQLDGGLSAGYTPARDPLRAYQRTTFVGGLLGTRIRIGQQALFGTVWMQSANWKGTGFTALESAEVTLDFGGLLKLGRGWPELQVGMTEDLLPRGPAVDAGFKLGVRWR